jgi:hypothetical protein
MFCESAFCTPQPTNCPSEPYVARLAFDFAGVNQTMQFSKSDCPPTMQLLRGSSRIYLMALRTRRACRAARRISGSGRRDILFRRAALHASGHRQRNSRLKHDCTLSAQLICALLIEQPSSVAFTVESEDSFENGSYRALVERTKIRRTADREAQSL